MAIRRERSIFSVPVEVIDRRDGFIAFITEREPFRDESGGHRWQRIPPTEHNGRVHTSSITVAVLPLLENFNSNLGEVKIETTRGSGPGGQHKNKTDSCVIATHIKSGLRVRIDSERSQYQNKQLATQILASRLAEIESEKNHSDQNSLRASLIGSGMRGDKVKTYRERDDMVTDNRTGKKIRLKDWRKGVW